MGISIHFLDKSACTVIVVDLSRKQACYNACNLKHLTAMIINIKGKANTNTRILQCRIKFLGCIMI